MKWADYGISAVRYDDDGSFITEVEVYYLFDEVDPIGPGQRDREQIIEAMDNDETFVTLLQVNGNWKKGADVHDIRVNGKRYIRTDANSTERDNLEELPVF